MVEPTSLSLRVITANILGTVCRMSMVSVDIFHGHVQLEYWNDLTGQCPLSMDSVDNFHGLSGHCPWTQWTISMDSVDIVQSVSGLFPHTLFRAMHSEGMLMFNLDSVVIVGGLSGQLPWTQWTLSMDMPFLFYDIQCL